MGIAIKGVLVTKTSLSPGMEMSRDKGLYYAQQAAGALSLAWLPPCPPGPRGEGKREAFKQRGQGGLHGT